MKKNSFFIECRYCLIGNVKMLIELFDRWWDKAMINGEVHSSIYSWHDQMEKHQKDKEKEEEEEEEGNERKSRFIDTRC